jgi:hypothetical protein
MSNFEGTLELKSPLTKECWDKLADVELENTERIWFTTPGGKRVEYIKADVLEQIRADIEREADYQDAYVNADVAKGMYMAIEIMDKQTK